MRAIFDDVEKLDSGSIYAVPDFAEKHAAISLNDALGRAEAGDDGELSRKLRDDERAVFTSLWFLSGKTVTVHRDGPLGKAVLDYRETLPPDLAPMVILDASGRVRETCRDIEAGRGTLVRLPTASKDYSPLTVHVWRTGGGTTAFAKSGVTLAAGIAKTIDTRPGERWLVVYLDRTAGLATSPTPSGSRDARRQRVVHHLGLPFVDEWVRRGAQRHPRRLTATREGRPQRPYERHLTRLALLLHSGKPASRRPLFARSMSSGRRRV